MDSSVHLALKRQNREAKKSQPGLRGTAGTHAFTSHGHLTATGTDLSLEAGLCLARCEFKGWGGENCTAWLYTLAGDAEEA